VYANSTVTFIEVHEDPIYILQSIYNGFFDRYLSLDNAFGVPINLQQWCEPVIIITFETVVELE